jgi:excisionase family DNA binding protein
MELEKLLTPEQLAELLGVKLSWIYRHSARGCKPPEQRLPSVTVGKKLRFRPSEIESWQDANRDRGSHQDVDCRALGCPKRVVPARGELRASGPNGTEKTSGSETEGQT